MKIEVRVRSDDDGDAIVDFCCPHCGATLRTVESGHSFHPGDMESHICQHAVAVGSVALCGTTLICVDAELTPRNDEVTCTACLRELGRRDNDS